MALCGCVNAVKLPLRYSATPENLPPLASKTFTLSVRDQRPYVTHGKKVSYFLGLHRDAMGIPRDVVQAKKVPLAEQMKGDLRQEFASLGLVESPAASSQQIAVVIHDWNFDCCSVKTRFWYDVEISVTGVEGKVLTSTRVKDAREIDPRTFNGLWSAADKPGILALYAQFIHELGRDNTAVLTALQLGR